MIGIEGGIDWEAIRTALEKCIHDEDEEMMPMMSRMRKMSTVPEKF